jgi:hypothetical protein
MSTEPDDTEERDDAGFEEQPPTEFLPDTLSSPAGQVYFGGDADRFLTHWLAKLGFEPEGSALTFCESGGLRILHPETGELLTMAEIAKLAGRQKLTRVQ